MGEVVDLDAQRPHFVVHLPDGKTHVMPVELVRKVGSGELPLEALGDDVVRRILREWLADRV